MPLESLLELVETLRNRIDEHRHALSGNEMLTRYALIDPVLRELGWDTSDPATIVPEDTSGLGRGRPDYVLLADTQPVMVVEAKKLGSGLQQGANQAVNYAMDPNRKARYFAITDGQSWEIFDTNRPASDMGVISFDLMATSSAEVCLNVLALWRPSVGAGSISAAQSPIVGSEREEASPITEVPPSQAVHSNATQSAPNNSGDDQNWIPLSEFSPEKEDKIPSQLRFPNGNAVPIQKWNMLITETVRWLYENGHITDSNPRVQGTRRLIVSDSPFNSNGQPFAQPKTIGPLYVETHGHRWTLIRNIRNVVSRTGQNPADFKVRHSS